MAVTLSAHYDPLVRDAAMNAITHDNTVEDIPYCIRALEIIAADGSSANLTAVDGKDLSGRFSSVQELFTEYEMWGIDDSTKAPFFALIKRISGEVATFFGSKTVEAQSVMLAESTTVRAHAITVRDALREVAREGVAESSRTIEADFDGIMAGKAAILMTIEHDAHLTKLFEDDCMEFYGRAYLHPDNLMIYNEVMLHPQPFCTLLFSRVRMKNIFQLGLNKIKSIIAHPEALDKLTRHGMKFPALSALPDDKFKYVLEHVDEVISSTLTASEITWLHIDKLKCIVANQAKFKALMGLPGMDRALFLKQREDILAACLTYATALQTLVGKGIKFVSFINLPPQKIKICLRFPVGVGVLVERYKVSIEDLSKFRDDKLESILSNPSHYTNIKDIPSWRINRMTVYELETLLFKPHSKGAIRFAT